MPRTSQNHHCGPKVTKMNPKVTKMDPKVTKMNTNVTKTNPEVTKIIPRTPHMEGIRVKKQLHILVVSQ